MIKIFFGLLLLTSTLLAIPPAPNILKNVREEKWPPPFSIVFTEPAGRDLVPGQLYYPSAKEKILVIIATVTIGCGYIVYRLRFPRTGSRSGQVIHAVTGQPIQGAVVNYVWKFMGFPFFYHEPVAGSYETTTDKTGKYFIPSQRFKRKFLLGPLKSEAVLIYKNNYAVYTKSGD